MRGKKSPVHDKTLAESFSVETAATKPSCCVIVFIEAVLAKQLTAQTDLNEIFFSSI